MSNPHVEVKDPSGNCTGNEKDFKIVLNDDRDTSVDEEKAIRKTFEINELEIDDYNSEDIDLNHCRINSISHLNLFPKVKNLCFRNNFIKKLDNLEPVSATLVDLDLYDNQLTQIEGLECLTEIICLDLSFNRIKVIENISSLVKLKKLFFVNNKLRKIENLDTLTSLEMIELGSNKIRKLENLDNLTNLDQLFVGKNKISKLEGLDNLRNLTLLSIQGNRITKLEGLNKLVNLEQLYLSHNGLTQIEGLENLTKLQTLDLASNVIEKIQNIDHLQLLEEFWFNDNKVHCWDELKVLVSLTNLRTLYLERNPIYYTGSDKTKMNPDYRRKILLLLPKLRQLDANLTGVGL